MIAFILYGIGVGLGLWTGFIAGVLYASGQFDFRLKWVSWWTCRLGSHDWKGLPVHMGWDECRSCGRLKDVEEAA